MDTWVSHRSRHADLHLQEIQATINHLLQFNVHEKAVHIFDNQSRVLGNYLHRECCANEGEHLFERRVH